VVQSNNSKKLDLQLIQAILINLTCSKNLKMQGSITLDSLVYAAVVEMCEIWAFTM
jgi:hypothetical protein